jgi:anti-anti-sigma factor
MMHTLKRETFGPFTVITLEIQSLDARNAQQITRRMAEAMDGGVRIIVDLGALQYFDVSGFAAILNWAGGGRQRAEVRLCSRSGTIRALFELLRAQKVVPLYRNCEEAMASFSSERRGADVKAPQKEDQLLPGQRIA